MIGEYVDFLSHRPSALLGMFRQLSRFYAGHDWTTANVREAFRRRGKCVASAINLNGWV